MIAQTAYDAKVSELESTLADKVDTVTATATKLAQDAEIAKKVAQTTYDAKVSAIESTLSGKLDTATANATKAAQDIEIAKKVAQTAYDTKVSELDSTISGHTTRIEATETGLLAKASTTEVDALKTRMSTAETSLTTNANEIALKAAQTDLDAVEGRLDTAESSLVVQAGQIASKVSQTTYDSGIATKENSIVKATTAPSHANGKLWLNTSVTPNILYRSTGSAWVKATPTTASEVGAYSSADGTTLAGRVTTAETTITQQGNQIALKAAQSELDSTNTRLSTAESTLTVQAGQIASKVSRTDFDAVNTRLGTAESTITQQATQIASKVAQTDFDAVEGRMDTAESTITQQASQIASKVATTTYNSGMASKENAIVKATTAPAHVAGLLWLNTSVTPNILNRSTGSAWVKVTPTTAAEVGAYSSTDGSNLAGRVSTAESTIVQQGNSIALKASQTDLNALDGRMDTAESTLTVQAGQIASKVSQTDFNAVENRVDSAESTITQQAAQIASKVSQSTYDTDINTATTGLKAKMSAAESTITQQATQIASKVSQTDFNAVNTRLGTAESTITQQAGEIASKVATTTYNAGIATKEDSITKSNTAPAHQNGRLWLNTSVTPNVLNRSTGTAWVKVTPTTASEVGAYSSTDGSSLATRVSIAETTITQQGNQIALKATQTDLDAAKSRLTTAEGTLTVHAGQIASKVSQTDFDGVEGRLDTAESTITQQATQIASKVSQTDFNSVNTRLGTAESTITQQATQIASKVATTTYNSGIAAKEDSIVKATTAPAHANGKLWLNTSVTPNVLNRSTGTAWVKVTPTTAAEVGAYSSSAGTTLAGRVTTAESTITQHSTEIASKVSQTDFNLVEGRVDTAESTISQQATQISSKVAQTTYDTKMGALDTAISTKANASDVSALTTRVTTAESNITQNANGIALRATKTEAQTYATNAQNAAINSAAIDATTKSNAALDNAKTYADGINLALGARVTSAESAITADAITNTVMGTTAFNAKLAEYAKGEELAGYTTIDEFTSIKNMAEETRNQVINLDFTPYVKTTQVEQLEDSINTKISQSGGVNLLRNSIGWNGTDFWTKTAGTARTIQTPELETLGFGSAFYSPLGESVTMRQNVTLPFTGTHTLSFYLNKSRVGTGGAKWAVLYLYENGVLKRANIGLSEVDGISNGYQRFSYTFTTTSTNIIAEIIIGTDCEATISGLMLNIGTEPLQWTSHSTEVYNTNVRMDINGIQVMGNRDGSKTVITPDEFSGYENGERIFTLNGDTTEVKKLRAEKQFEMAPITIVTIDNASYKGWAFI